MVNSRGYFFMIDAAIASIILFLGVIVLFGSSINAPEEKQQFMRAEDFASILYSQPLIASTNSYYVSTLLPSGLVPTPDTTAIEEIAYLKILEKQGCVACGVHAYQFAKLLTDQVLEPQRGGAIIVNGTLIYNRSNPPIDVFIARPTILYVRMNETNITGPFTAEVQVW